MEIITDGAIETEESCSLLEEEVSKKLPLEYRLFLLKYGSAAVLPDSFSVEELGDEFSVQFFLPILTPKENPEIPSIQYYLPWIASILGQNFIPIAICDSGELILVGMDKSDYGYIYFLDRTNVFDDTVFSDNVFLINTSFDEFLSSLH